MAGVSKKSQYKSLSFSKTRQVIYNKIRSGVYNLQDGCEVGIDSIVPLTTTSAAVNDNSNNTLNITLLNRLVVGRVQYFFFRPGLEGR